MAKKFPNQTVERLTALRGILNMHERAQKRGKPCKLNGESRILDMYGYDCGTTACALGSCGLNPWFKERGLKSYQNGPGTPGYVKYKGNRGFSAATAFFGISREEALNIFHPQSYGSVGRVRPSVVRDRVDELIEKYSKE